MLPNTRCARRPGNWLVSGSCVLLLLLLGPQMVEAQTIRYDFRYAEFTNQSTCTLCWCGGDELSESDTTYAAGSRVVFTDQLPPGSTVSNVNWNSQTGDTSGASATIGYWLNGTNVASQAAWGDPACVVGTWRAVNGGQANWLVGVSNTAVLSSPTGLWFTLTNGSATSAATKFQLTATYTLPANTAVWTGATNTDWNTASNWQPAAVPGAATNVYVPNTAGFFQAVMNGSTIIQANQPTLTAAGTCNNLTIATGRTVNLGANTLTVNGNFTNDGTFSGGGGTTVFGGATAATVSGAGTTNFGVVTFNKTAAVAVSSTLTFSASGTITNQGSGTFAPSSGTITASDVDVVNTGTAIWNASGGSLTMTGGTNRAITNTSTAAAPQVTFFNFVMSKSAGIDITSTDNWTVSGDYTNTLGNLVCTAGTVTFTGTANRTFAVNGGSVQFNNLTVNMSAGINRNHTAGSFNVIGNYLCSGGTFNSTAGTQTFNGSATATIDQTSAGATTFNNLTINKSAAAATVTTTQTAGTFTVTGNVVNQGSGSFIPSTGTLNINGNVTNTSPASWNSIAGTVRLGGTGAATITATGPLTFFNLTVDKSAAVNVTTTNSFSVNGTYTNSGSGSFAANEGVETPWQTYQNGTLVTGDGLDYTMGYRFTVNVNGRITKLGGYFSGTKLITLWNASTQTVVAQASVTSANTWVYSSIPPVNVAVGEVYTVSVYLAGTGGSHRESINTLPRVYNSITIEDGRYSIGNVYPTTTDLTRMWGQVDLEVQALPTLTMAGGSNGAVNHTSSGTSTFANVTVNKPGGIQVNSSTNWTVTGNFASTGAGVFSASGGTVTFNGSAQTANGAATPVFNNLTVGAGTTLTPTSNMDVGGTLLVSGTFRMTGNQTVRIGTAAASGTLTVNGTLNCSGTTPTITAVAAGFPMTCNVNGTVNLQRLNFSRADASGMNLVSGSTVVAFNNVAFTNATVGGRHLTINNAVTATFSGCSFDNTYGASPPGYNVLVNNAGANVTMGNWSGNGGGEAFDNDLSGIVTWESSPPNAPTNLLAEQSTNPINVLDSRPEFQATFTDPDVADTAPSYQLQVSTDSTFATVSHWDSGWVNFVTPLANGAAIVAPGENYGGTFMTWAIQYFWRIRFRDNNSVVGAWSATANFTMGVPSVTLPNNGWNMVTVPRFDNASVSSVFGDDIPGVVVYEWNETARSWQQTLTVQPGRGYLIFSSASFVDTDTGTARWGDLTISNLGYTTLGAPTQYENATNQFRGWHVIGHPFNPSVNWTTIWGGSTNLGDTYQYWNGTTYVWYDASPPTDGGAGNAVPAWRGIWVNVLSATNTIIIPNPKNPPEPGEPAFDANYWRLQIQVESSGAKDTSNYAGVRGNASDGYDTGEVKDLGSLANPYSTAYFDHTADWPLAPDRYTQQMNQTPFTAGAQTRFPLTVDQNTATTVTLSFPNFAQMPTSDWAYQIEDMDTFQLYNIVNGFTLGFTPGAAGQKRYDIIATRLTSFASTLTCTQGPQNPSAGPVGATQNDVVMLQMRLAAANEGISVDQIRVRASGSGNDATMISGARLYHDVNRNGALDAGDTLISGPKVFAADDGSVLFWNLDWGIPSNDSEDWLVVYNFNASGTNGGTFRAWFDPATDVQAHGDSSRLILFGSGTTVSGPVKTVPDGVPPVAPVLVSPVNGAWIPNGAPSFDWNDVADAVSYYVQMDNNPDFSSPEASVGGLTSSAYAQATSLPMGTWYWRVYAVDAGSNLGPWSETRSFLVAPAPRSEVAVGLGTGGGGQFADFDDGEALYAFLALNRVPWNAYGTLPSGGQTHLAQGDLDGDGLEEIVVGLSNDGGGWLSVQQSLAGGRALVRWIRVPWAQYNAAAGMTWPACGNVDGDPRSEIVVGLGPYPTAGGWFCVFDDGAAANAFLGWKRLPWASYNTVNGEVRPATGDVDGEGRDEVVLGLGASGSGWIAVMEDWQAGMGLRSWIRVPWASYNSANGSTWVASGDADSDGRAEVVAGLGNGGNGTFYVFEDAAAGHALLATRQLPWSVYNAGRGETRPAMGNVDSDPREELMLGVGPTGAGWWAAMGNAQDGFAFRRWGRVPWSAYNTANGETWPSVGDGGGN